MAVGDQNDITQRIQRWQPARWFPTQSVNPDGTVPRVYAMFTGFASALAQVFNQIAYAKAQTRTSTSSDGWLDLRSRDFLANWLPRNPGESDPAFRVRFDEMLLQPANTEKALIAAIQWLTGEEPEIVEPFSPADTGVFDGAPGAGAAYYDADCAQAPARFTDPSLRCQIFINSTLPVINTLGNMAMPCFDAQSYTDTYTSSAVDLTTTTGAGRAELYAWIMRLKSKGIRVWVKILAKPQQQGLFWDEPGYQWDQGETWDQANSA